MRRNTDQPAGVKRSGRRSRTTGLTAIAGAAFLSSSLLLGCGSSAHSPQRLVAHGICGYTTGPLPTPTLATTTAKKARHFTVGFVTDTGGLGDRSFNDMAASGLRRAENQYGVKGQVLQSRSQPDYIPNLTRLAQRRTGLIIGLGTSMARAMYKVAQAYPAEKFALIDAPPLSATGTPAGLPNIASLFFKEEQAGYLVGAIAGLMEKQKIGKARLNTVGFMGGQSIPEVNRYIAGYVAGAKCLDPKVKVVGDYSQTYTDTATGRAIALKQIGEGADILFGVAAATGVAYVQTAGEKGVYGIGVDADESYLGPFILASAVKRVDVAVRDEIFQAQTHHFVPGARVFTAADGAIGFGKTSTSVPAPIVRRVNGYLQKLASEKIIAPTTIPRY